MTDLERRVLAAVLEFAKANHDLRRSLMRWGKAGFSRYEAEQAQARATSAREAWAKVSDEYRVANQEHDETLAELLAEPDDADGTVAAVLVQQHTADAPGDLL